MCIYKNLDIKNLKNEIFKDIPGYVGYYQVSNLGRVKSLSRKYSVRKRILKQDLIKKGYLQTHLFKNKKQKIYKVHRLVMLVFKEFSNLTVNHKNGIKTDNRLCNLEYCTNLENMKHAWKNGIKNVNYLKVKVKQYDLNNNFIREYESMSEASRQIKGNVSCIQKCVAGKFKKAYGYIWKK